MLAGTSLRRRFSGKNGRQPPVVLDSSPAELTTITSTSISTSTTMEAG
jgi:hypothetical protein